MKKYLLAIVLALTTTPVFAQTPVPTRMESNPLQYMQSCMPGPVYSEQFSQAVRAKVIVVPGSSSTGSYPYASRLLLGWGTQWKLSCDANGAVLACLHQTLGATVSLGLGNDGGDGAGYTTADSANSATGQARCIAVTAATPTDFIKISPASFKCGVGVASRDPMTRCGKCTVVGAGYSFGAPCSSASDCGSGGTCDTTTRPDGVFLSLVPVSASSVCYLSRCDQ